MPLAGLATAEGTQQFRDRAVRERAISFEHFRPAPGGLSLSSLGLGTYIGAPDASTDFAVEQAITVSLSSARVNVLDTAINYRYQRAERSIGRALARLVAKGEVARSSVFIATKSGYFAPDGESKTPPERWIAEHLIRPGILDPADVVDDSHAMSPSYLLDQFERSRANLGLEAIDLVYLHNAPDAQIPSIGRDAFLGRLEAAFRLYETLRGRGQLGSYGLATWDSLRAPRTDPSYLSLESAVRLARKVGGEEHGFRFVQFPFNLGMPEAATLPNQPVGKSFEPVFSAAPKLGVACFTSIPLMQGRLSRSGPKRNGLTSAQTALQFARSAPGSLAALVGQKDPAHLSENLELAVRRPWDRATFETLLT
ncbi:MAG TPA: aldo/keto reductase [Thermoplasmata archaeon]|nr:aldo/keto reductase [Thermoplasmata archaeon]